MPTSKRFKQLRSELRRLRSHFLPQRWDPMGAYSERKLDRARAYRILAHAEIEFFIERMLLDIVDREFQRWRNSKKPSHVMICLIAASKVGWQDMETEELGLTRINPPLIKKDHTSIEEVIERAVEQYRKIVKDNHGIMESNLKRLVMPVGIALSDLDSTWLADMNSFGGRRGSVAHTSRLGVTTPIDPQTEKGAVDNLLVGLEELDELANEL